MSVSLGSLAIMEVAVSTTMAHLHVAVHQDGQDPYVEKVYDLLIYSFYFTPIFLHIL
jgi:hypothetical protein